MANTLAGLIPSLYAARDIVSRELTGFIPAMSVNASDSRAALGQSITIHQAPASVSTDITPAMVVPNPAGQTIGNTTISISKSKAVEFGWNGEEQLGINSGSGYRNVVVDQIAQAMRTLTNEIESDCAALFINSSRAYGTAGTTPFATNLKDTAQINKILSDNGAPPDRHLVLGTTAGADLRTLQNLTRVNEAGGSDVLMRGELIDIHGLKIRESAQIKSVTAGTVTVNVTVTGANAVGATTINVTTDATGAVALNAGDVITFAGDSNKYVIAVAVTIGNSTTGDLVIAAPGLQIATAGSEVVAVGAGFEANMAFSRNAMQLITRLPARPEEGTLAADSEIIIDPVSGIAFEVSMYPGYHKVMMQVAAAWGVGNIKPEHTALLLG